MTGFKVLGISWVGIGTDHYAETSRLFCNILGLTSETGIENQSILTVNADQQIEIFGREGPGKTNNSPPAIGLEVDNFDAALTALKDAKVELVGDEGSWETHRWQYFRTPDGYLMSIKTSNAG